MTFQDHPVDSLLRAAAVQPVLSYADVLEGRRRLDAAIAAETTAERVVPVRPARRPRGWLRPASAAAMAMALIIAVVAVTGMLSPQPVTALGELAAVAERRDAVTVTEGEFVYTSVSETGPQFIAGFDIGLDDVETVVYLLPVQRERWQSADGRIVEETTVKAPVFFDRLVASAYAEAGMAERDGVGQVLSSEYTNATSILDQRAWPVNPRALAAAMRAQVSSEGNPLPESAALVELASSLLKETTAPAELRAAVFQVLDDLGLNAVVKDNGDRVQVAIDYVDTVPTRLELEFDQGANLVAERFIWTDGAADLGVPAGTVIQETVLSPARTATSIDGS